VGVVQAVEDGDGNLHDGIELEAGLGGISPL
jgi:hypothetical protein